MIDAYKKWAKEEGVVGITTERVVDFAMFVGLSNPGALVEVFRQSGILLSPFKLRVAKPCR